jgi:hypothetical protein
VVAADRDSDPSAGLDLLGGVVDRARAPQRRRLAADAAAGDIDRRTFFPDDERDALAAATARAGDERDLSIQAAVRHGGTVTTPRSGYSPLRGRIAAVE